MPGGQRRTGTSKPSVRASTIRLRVVLLRRSSPGVGPLSHAERACVGLAIVAIGQGTGPPIRLRCVKGRG